MDFDREEPAIAAPPLTGGPGSPPDEVLGWAELFKSMWRLFRLSFRLALRRKLWLIGAGVLAYFAILYTVAVYDPGEGLSAPDALFVLVELPGAVLGIYLAMDLISRERDGNTLEILFSTASSHYAVWTVRLLCVWGVLLVALVSMSTIVYFFFAETPFVRGGLNAFLPAFFMVNLTFFLSVACRSGNTAGMLALGFLLLVLMTSDGLDETYFYLFLNPFDLPIGANEAAWAEKVLYNRLGVAGAGAVLLFLGLRRMGRREKFL